MEKTNKFFVFNSNTLLLIAILVIGIILLTKEYNGVSSSKKADVATQKNVGKAVLDSAIVYVDSLTKVTNVWIVGDSCNQNITIWSTKCPEKVVIVSKPKTFYPRKKKVKVNDTIRITDTVIVNKIKDPPFGGGYNPDQPADTLNVSVESITSDSTLLFKEKSVLPMKFDGKNYREFNYQFNPKVVKTESWRIAKKHLIIGTAIAGTGAITYASTFFFKVPTFVKDGEKNYYDPTNKYCDRNKYEQKRLKTLKWVRGVSIGVTALGTLEIIHGIRLLKDATLDIAPEKITLKYTF